MKFWHPDPLGRRTGKSDPVRFMEWYAKPYRNPLEWSVDLALQRATRAYGTWFALGYAEAYFAGAPVGARYAAGISGAIRTANWKFLFPRVAIPLTVATVGAYLISKIPPSEPDSYMYEQRMQIAANLFRPQH